MGMRSGIDMEDYANDESEVVETTSTTSNNESEDK